MIRFNVFQGDVNLVGEYSQPAFGQFRDAPALNQEIFTQLSKHGLRLSDMRYERADGSLGEAGLTCLLPWASTTIRFRFDKVEVSCLDVLRPTRKQLEEIAVDSLEIMKVKAVYRSFAVGLNLHGKLEGTKSSEFLSRFVTGAPTKVGGLLGSAVAFYFDAAGERLISSVTMDLSAVRQEALFVRLNVVWDASKIGARDIPGATNKHNAQLLNELGLALPPESV